MRRIFLFAVLLLASATTGPAEAVSGFECVVSKCDAKSRSCVETLYVAYNACVKEARAKCDRVPPAEKFDCLRKGLSPCAGTRNKEQSACKDGAQACYGTCAPFSDKRTHYWCVGSTRTGATAAFCAVNIGFGSPFEACSNVLQRDAGFDGGMSCEPMQQ